MDRHTHRGVKPEADGHVGVLEVACGAPRGARQGGWISIVRLRRAGRAVRGQDKPSCAHPARPPPPGRPPGPPPPNPTQAKRPLLAVDGLGHADDAGLQALGQKVLRQHCGWRRRSASSRWMRRQGAQLRACRQAGGWAGRRARLQGSSMPRRQREPGQAGLPKPRPRHSPAALVLESSPPMTTRPSSWLAAQACVRQGGAAGSGASARTVRRCGRTEHSTDRRPPHSAPAPPPPAAQASRSCPARCQSGGTRPGCGSRPAGVAAEEH